MYVLAKKGLEVNKSLQEYIFNMIGNCSKEESMAILSAISNDRFIGKRFIHFPETVLAEISKYQIEDGLFVPCFPLELDAWLGQDKMFSFHPRLCHHIRSLEKNYAHDVFGIKIKKEKSVKKIGSFNLLHGSVGNFMGAIDCIICDSKFMDTADRISKKYGNSIPVNSFINFIKTSASYEINIPKLGIKESVEADTPYEALSKSLKDAWGKTEESKFFRRVPPDYNAETWMSNPIFSSDVVKLASCWPPMLGSRVRARPSNGMPGGNIGTVIHIGDKDFTVDFSGKMIKYENDNPRTLMQLDTDLT